MPGPHRRLQQVERARDVHIDKGLRGIARDIGLVERCGVDHRLHPAIEGVLDHAGVGDRADDLRIRTRRDIEAHHIMPGGAQARGEKAAKPAG